MLFAGAWTALGAAWKAGRKGAEDSRGARSGGLAEWAVPYPTFTRVAASGRSSPNARW